MNTVTRITPRNEATVGESPQLAGGDVAVTGATESDGVDVTLELADLSAGQLSAVAALMIAFEAAEKRARSAERQLAEHHRHCICGAAHVAAEDASASISLRAAA